MNSGNPVINSNSPSNAANNASATASPPLTVQQLSIINSMVQHAINLHNQQQLHQGLPPTNFTQQQIQEATDIAIQQYRSNPSHPMFQQQLQNQNRILFQQQFNRFPLQPIQQQLQPQHIQMMMPMVPMQINNDPTQLIHQALIQSQQALAAAHQAQILATQAQQLARTAQAQTSISNNANNATHQATSPAIDNINNVSTTANETAAASNSRSTPASISTESSNIVTTTTSSSSSSNIAAGSITPTLTAQFLAANDEKQANKVTESTKPATTAEEKEKSKPAAKPVKSTAKPEKPSEKPKVTTKTSEASNINTTNNTNANNSNNNNAIPTNLPPPPGLSFPLSTQQQLYLHPGIRVVYPQPNQMKYFIMINLPNQQRIEVEAHPALINNDSTIVLVFKPNPSINAFQQILPPNTVHLPNITDLKNSRAFHQHQQQQAEIERQKKLKQEADELAEEKALQELANMKKAKLNKQQEQKIANNNHNNNATEEKLNNVSDNNDSSQITLTCPEFNRIIVEATSVELHWNPISQAESVGVLYLVELKLSGNRYETIYMGPKCNILIEKLQPRSSYNYRVQAVVDQDHINAKQYKPSDHSYLVNCNTLNS